MGLIAFCGIAAVLVAYPVWTVARTPVGEKRQSGLLGLLPLPWLTAVTLGHLFAADRTGQASPTPPPWAGPTVMMTPLACCVLVLLLVFVMRGGNRMRAAFYGAASLLFTVFAALAASMDIRAAYF